MSQTPARPDVVQVSEGVATKPQDLGDMEQGNGSGGISTDETREPSMASRRLIPAPDSLPLSIQPPPDPSAEGKETASASLGRKCAPSQAPATDTADYDQLSSGQ